MILDLLGLAAIAATGGLVARMQHDLAATRRALRAERRRSAVLDREADELWLRCREAEHRAIGLDYERERAN